MGLFLRRPLICFDLETTSLDTRSARIVEVFCIKCHPNGRRESLSDRLNPECSIPVETIAVHGITDEAVAFCPTFRDRAETYWDFFVNCDVAGYNVTFYDWPVLLAEWRRADLDDRIHWRPRFIDPYGIFRAKEPHYPGRRNLRSAARFYLNEQLDDTHHARTDATAALSILEAQIDRYRDLTGKVTALARHSRRNTASRRRHVPV